MDSTNEFSLIQLPQFHPLRGTYCRLKLKNGRISPFIRGEDISVQIAIGDWFLLITNCDNYDWTSHWVYLVNSDGKILDMLSTPDYFGFAEKLCYESPSSISVGFFGTNDRWTISVEGDGYWSFDISAILRRLNSFVVRKRYLMARCTKGEKWVFQGTR